MEARSGRPRFRCYPTSVSTPKPEGIPDDVVLDLSDTEAVVLCLSCGGRYARAVKLCATCGGAHLVARERLAAAVRRTAPGRPPFELDRLRLVRVFVAEDPDALDAIRRGMTEAGYPHVAVSRDGTLVEAGPAGGGVAFFAPEEDEPAIREQVGAWLPFDAGEIEGEPDPSADLERANEPLEGLEGIEPEAQRILEEDLEHLALAGSSSVEAEAEPAHPPRTRRPGRAIRRVLLGAIALGCAALAFVSPASGAQSIVAWIGAAVAALVLALDVMNPGPE